MDYSRLDRVRRSASTPSRARPRRVLRAGQDLAPRQFIKRATVVGLSWPSDQRRSSPRARTHGPATGGAPARRLGRRQRRPPRGRRRHHPHRHPATGRRSTRSRCRTSAATASSPSRSSSCPPSIRRPVGHRPGLADEWEPNADNTRLDVQAPRGVKWQDGGDFTADDVVATMGRLVAAGNAGLEGRHRCRIRPRRSIPMTVEFTLVSANGNFPYLVSVFNAQTVITPAAYAAGTTLDAMPNGTGAWKLETYDAATGARFVRNDGWWGGATPLDAVEYTFFDETGPMVAAYQGGQIDAIVQFDVFSGHGAVQRPELPGQRGGDDQPSPDLVPHGHRPVHRQARPPGASPCRSTATRWSSSSSRAAARSPTTTSSSASTRTSTRPSRSGHATSRRRRHCWPRPTRPA